MHKFHPDNAIRLERAERYQLIPPRETLQRFGVKQGMTVVDIGAGTGFFARAAAELTGPSGHVYAADMAPAMVDHLQANGVPGHVTAVLSGEYTVPLSDGVADLTLMAFVVHETPDIARFVAEAARVTKKGGSIVILEWTRQNEEHGPDERERLDEQELLETLSPRYRVRDHGTLNASHYFIVLTV